MSARPQKRKAEGLLDNGDNERPISPTWTEGMPAGIARMVIDDGDLLLACSTSDQTAAAGCSRSPKKDSLLLVHKQVVKWASEPLKTALQMALPLNQVSRLPMLQVDGSPQAWLKILPHLYPKCAGDPPPMTWETAAGVLEVAHKYDLSHLVTHITAFLGSKITELSYRATPKHTYVLHWLELSDRLQLDDLKERIMAHMAKDGLTWRRILCFECRIEPQLQVNNSKLECCSCEDYRYLKCTGCNQHLNNTDAVCECSQDSSNPKSGIARALQDKEGLMRLSQATVVELLGRMVQSTCTQLC